MQLHNEASSFMFLADRQDAIPTVARWYYEAWGNVPGNSVQKTIDRIQAKLNRHKPPCHILAILNDQVLGVAQLKLHEMTMYPDKEFWLGSLFVSPDWRGRGVGSALANEIATIAKGFGVKQLYLQTEALDGGFYRRLGWELIETTTYNTVRVAVMVRHLAE